MKMTSHGFSEGYMPQMHYEPQPSQFEQMQYAAHGMQPPKQTGFFKGIFKMIWGTLLNALHNITGPFRIITTPLLIPVTLISGFIMPIIRTLYAAFWSFLSNIPVFGIVAALIHKIIRIFTFPVKIVLDLGKAIISRQPNFLLA